MRAGVQGYLCYFPVIVNMTGVLTSSTEKRPTVRITEKPKCPLLLIENCPLLSTTLPALLSKVKLGPHLRPSCSVDISLHKNPFVFYCNFLDLLFQECDCLLNCYSHSAASRPSKHHYTSAEYELWALAVPFI